MEDECHAVAHHIRVIQASGTNNTKSTTELSPVLIRILLISGNHKLYFMPTLDQKLLSATSKWNCQSWTWTPSSRRWNPRPGLLYIWQIHLILEHLAFVNGNNRALSIEGQTTIQENIAHLWYWFWKLLRGTLKIPQLTPRTLQRRWALRDALTAPFPSLLAGAEKQTLALSVVGGNGGVRFWSPNSAF